MHRRHHRPRRPERQPDLFPAARPPAAAAGPGWDGLPDQARHALAALMTRLLVTHADGAMPRARGDADER